MKKKILNTHIAEEEHEFLRAESRARAMTITMFLRNLIRREMAKKQMATLQIATLRRDGERKDDRDVGP